MRNTALSMLIILYLLMVLIPQPCMVTTLSGCQSDRDKDHRPRVSCVRQGLATVPDGIHPDTQTLVLSQNAFVSLSWDAYTTFTHLYELDLSQNLISTINQSGPVLRALRVLRLSNNKLTGLTGDVFKFTPSLMEVYLDGNTISFLDNTTFSNLPFIEVINLSRNKLHFLPHFLLKHISSRNLKTFDLEENQVQHLPNDFFANQPELPYVFLSKNLWVCTCQVSYLQHYLNDQGHNVYKHTGPSSRQNDPESVVCSAPPTLQGQSIIDLEEEEYCSVVTNSQHSTTRTPQLTSIQITTPNTTTLQLQVITSVIPTTEQTTVQPTPPKTVMSGTTPICFTLTTNILSTITPTTPISTVPTASPTTTLRTIHLTTPKTVVSSTTTIPTSNITTNNPITTNMVPVVTYAAGRLLSQRSVPWCWWLFISVLLLCILSAIFSCMLFLWLIVTYITLYQPIKQSDKGMTLRGYQAIQESLRMDRMKENRVNFLTPEMIRETQPVFRSVLFISKGEEEGEADERREGTTEDEEKRRGTDKATKIDQLPAVSLHRHQETETRNRKEVFRKTLFREISHKEQIEGWREVEENQRGMAERDKERREGGVKGRKTRYSLVLREETGSVMEGRKGETEWLVGEWENEGRGQGIWGSLIRMSEGCGLSDSTHMDTPEPVAETSV